MDKRILPPFRTWPHHPHHRGLRRPQTCSAFRTSCDRYCAYPTSRPSPRPPPPQPAVRFPRPPPTTAHPTRAYACHYPTTHPLAAFTAPTHTLPTAATARVAHLAGLVWWRAARGHAHAACPLPPHPSARPPTPALPHLVWTHVIVFPGTGGGTLLPYLTKYRYPTNHLPQLVSGRRAGRRLCAATCYPAACRAAVHLPLPPRLPADCVARCDHAAPPSCANYITRWLDTGRATPPCCLPAPRTPHTPMPVTVTRTRRPVFCGPLPT